MKAQQILILFSFLGLMEAVVKAQDSAHVYCGRNLAVTLAMLCENGMMLKRADSYSNYNAIAPHWPWLAPQRARSMERGKRQVAAECCDKPCTMDELLSYCAN